jgi:hypothetical protein
VDFLLDIPLPVIYIELAQGKFQSLIRADGRGTGLRTAICLTGTFRVTTFIRLCFVMWNVAPCYETHTKETRVVEKKMGIGIPF